MKLNIEDSKIAVVGLGYVGLPLAVAFAKKFNVIGFDINTSRIEEISATIDHTQEVSSEELHSVINARTNKASLSVSSSLDSIKDCNVYIITVPTPTDKHNNPDLSPLFRASESVGKVLKRGDVVIYESTVYPGVTEDECVPLLEHYSELTFNLDFYAGYSPERINPGDKEHTVTKILKVTSGSTPEAADFINGLYKKVITAGTYKASSIKVAEAAKVIENSQRDINIAFINELSKIFHLMEIDTHEVLEAASTKWNFMPFKPGLVGGHCIGVDPYYLAQKAKVLGYNPEIILAGRRLNDGMGAYIATRIVKLLINNGTMVKGAKILILGITFKENCTDVRNTKVIDIISELRTYGAIVTVFDPWASRLEVSDEYGLELINDYVELQDLKFDAIVLAVGHEAFKTIEISKLKKRNCLIYDVKAFYDKSDVSGRL